MSATLNKFCAPVEILFQINDQEGLEATKNRLREQLKKELKADIKCIRLSFNLVLNQGINKIMAKQISIVDKYMRAENTVKDIAIVTPPEISRVIAGILFAIGEGFSFERNIFLIPSSQDYTNGEVLNIDNQYFPIVININMEPPF